MTHKKRVMCAMSGGVDSSCAAALLLKEGFSVIGATFRLFAQENETEVPMSIQDAHKVAHILGIPHIVIDMIPEFAEFVIKPFISEYVQGRTPNPCINCNKYIKFGKALDISKSMGCDYIATGHYARIGYDSNINRYLVKKSLNSKDQSYCFYTLSQEQLSKIILPLVGFEKSEVRNMARSFGLPVFDKPESQDICFIKNNYVDFIENYQNVDNLIGNFIDEDGKFLGKHKGLHRYTIGQRRGLGLSFGSRAYIKCIDFATKNIIISYKTPPVNNFLIAKNVNFVLYDKFPGCNMDGVDVLARTRYNCTEYPAKIVPEREDKIRVKFNDSIKFIAPGQSVVFYDKLDKETLVGGGIIM
ncbi:MAG: tRNA 2-thiouridine(34) synthase MnmA [Candidatus Improbicoccus devescovinae]|nr:MAG: tRNA 2-thiouridine(34) synthase MnmA [Candidatus Improbicoccus devescovinae]